MNTSLLTRFGQQVRAHRLKLGISQEQLAARCGLHRTYIGGIERGERNVSLVNIVRIATELGVSPGDLLNPAAQRHCQHCTTDIAPS